MYITTNLKYNFGSYEDLLKYMQEENINIVECSLSSDFYDVKLPTSKMTINDIKNHIEAVKGDK